MEVRKELYIGGHWTAPQSSGEIAVIDSRTEEVMGSVPRGGAAEVEQAVAAARRRSLPGPPLRWQTGWRRCAPSPTASKRAPMRWPS